MNNQINLTQKQCAPTRPLHKKYQTGIFIAIACLFITAMDACKSNNTPSQPFAQNADTSAIIRDSLQSQYNAARLQIDGLATRNSALDSEIRLKDAQILQLKGKLNREIKNNKALAAALKKDKKFIASLKDELSDKGRSFAERIGLLETDKDNLSRERDSLLARYDRLKELGSVLHASNIRLAALHLKHHGRREKKTARARKVDVLRVYFDIDENRIAEDGTKKLYLAIKDPDGHLLTNVSGSGVTNFTTGEPLQYSVLKQIPLKQDEPVKDITVDWKQDSDYEKGLYSIVIYNGGYKIGGGDVMLN